MLALLAAPPPGPGDDDGRLRVRARPRPRRRGGALPSAGRGHVARARSWHTGCRAALHRPSRSGSTSTCRSARRAAATATSTPTRRPSWRAPARPRTGWLDAVRRELERAAAVVGPRPVDTVFVGGGTPSLLGAERLATVLDAVRSTFGLAPGRGGDDREQPGVDVAGVLRGPGRGRLHPGLAGDAVGGPARAARAGAPAHAGPGRRGGAGGAGGGARARQPGPDLRHAGGDGRRPAGVAGRRAGRRGRPRLGVRADRRGRHRAGPPGGPRRAARPGRRRGRGALRADRRRG